MTKIYAKVHVMFLILASCGYSMDTEGDEMWVMGGHDGPEIRVRSIREKRDHFAAWERIHHEPRDPKITKLLNQLDDLKIYETDNDIQVTQYILGAPDGTNSEFINIRQGQQVYNYVRHKLKPPPKYIEEYDRSPPDDSSQQEGPDKAQITRRSSKALLKELWSESKMKQMRAKMVKPRWRQDEL